MADLEKALDLLSDLTLLKFFPADAAARLALAKLTLDMAYSNEQIEWLVKRTMSLCNEWPGPLVLRQIFCSKFKPRDGIEAGSTSVFPEGVPSERLIQAPAVKALPPGRVATLDAGMDKALASAAGNLIRFELPPDYAHLEQLRRARLRRQHRELFETLGLTPVTQQDIDRAVEEARQKRGGTP